MLDHRAHLTAKMREALPLPELIPNFPWDEYKEVQQFTLLHEIVCRISPRDLDSAVQTHSADINKLDHDGHSPLDLAIRHSNIAAIRTLLRRGADPNASNGTPICEALSSSNKKTLEIVELLLRSGATVHGSAEIVTAWIESPPKVYEWQFENASELLILDRVLIEHGIDINHQAQGQTLLMCLCTRVWTETSIDRIEQLIGLGADLELRDFTGRTALHLAFESDNFGAIKLLFHAGARLDVKTNDGDTVAHLAVICSKSCNRVKALSEIDLGRLDLDTKNEDGHTAYDLLRKRNGLKWEKYCEKLDLSGPYDICFYRDHFPEKEYRTILALEALLHHIQDLQGVPKDQQYPPLGEYLSDDKDEDPVPGAWPV